MPFITDLYRARGGEYRALVIANTLFCGECEPQEDPIEMRGLD